MQIINIYRHAHMYKQRHTHIYIICIQTYKNIIKIKSTWVWLHDDIHIYIYMHIGLFVYVFIHIICFHDLCTMDSRQIILKLATTWEMVKKTLVITVSGEKRDAARTIYVFKKANKGRNTHTQRTKKTTKGKINEAKQNKTKQTNKQTNN